MDEETNLTILFLFITPVALLVVDLPHVVPGIVPGRLRRGQVGCGDVLLCQRGASNLQLSHVLYLALGALVCIVFHLTTKVRTPLYLQASLQASAPELGRALLTHLVSEVLVERTHKIRAEVRTLTLHDVSGEARGVPDEMMRCWLRGALCLRCRCCGREYTAKTQYALCQGKTHIVSHAVGVDTGSIRAFTVFPTASVARYSSPTTQSLGLTKTKRTQMWSFVQAVVHN